MSSEVVKKLAIIGLGGVARHYCEAIARMEGVALSTVVDPYCKVSLPRGVSLFPTVTNLLKDSDPPRYAIICTPPKEHYEIAKVLLANQIHCLVEKPLTLRYDSAQELYALAKSQNVKLMTAGKFRIALEEAKNRVGAGVVGELQSVESTLSAQYDATQNWRINPEISGGGVWMDNGPHALDVLESLAGPVEAIRMVEFVPHPLVPSIEESVVVETRHQNGVKGKMTMSWKNHIEAPLAFCIGSKGSYSIDWGHYHRLHCFQKMVANLISTEGYEDHGLRTLNSLEKGYLSYRTGRWEKVGDV